MKNEQINFRIVEGHEIPQELKDTIIKEYTETDKTKADVIKLTCKKFGISNKKSTEILRKIPNKPRSSVKHRSPVMDVIDAQGGVKLIKALRMERWSNKQIAIYLGVSTNIISRCLMSEGLSTYDLHKTRALNDEDIIWVKKKYGIK